MPPCRLQQPIVSVLRAACAPVLAATTWAQTSPAVPVPKSETATRGAASPLPASFANCIESSASVVLQTEIRILAPVAISAI